MATLRIRFHGFDLGPAKNLGMVAEAAIQAGHRVHFAGNDESVWTPLTSGVDAVVTGLSSVVNKSELRLGEECREHGIPWVMLSDTHGSWGRQNAKGKIDNAILLAAHPEELAAAKAFGYERTMYIGGPPLWQEFWIFKGTPDQLSAIRTSGRRPIIHVGGIKHSGITNSLLRTVIAAGLEAFRQDWTLAFNPHPNEKLMPEDAQVRSAMLQSVHAPNFPCSSSGLIDFAEISVFTCGATSLIEAAHRRRPVIYYEDDAVRNRMIEQTGEPLWFPVEAGVALKATDEEIMALALGVLCDGSGVEALAKQQSIVYPPPADPKKRVEQAILHVIDMLVPKPN